MLIQAGCLNGTISRDGKHSGGWTTSQAGERPRPHVREPVTGQAEVAQFSQSREDVVREEPNDVARQRQTEQRRDSLAESRRRRLEGTRRRSATETD